MAWTPWTCPVDCSLPSNAVTEVAPYGEISGPGVVAGFVVTAGVIVLAVTTTYLLWSDAHDGIHHAQKNIVDEIVLENLREIGRSTGAYCNSLIPRRISSWLAIILSQDRISRAFSTSLLALSDIQILTGLTILISGFVSLCPSSTQQNGLPAYHWQILVHLAWFSTITHQGTLFLMQKYFREHRWQMNVRLSLMCALLVLLIIAMVPTASFNWYSKRYLIHPGGPSDPRGLVPDDWLVSYFTLAKSAAQPVSPTLCYFDVSSANNLYRSADPCPWGDFTPLRPPRLTAVAASIIRIAITSELAKLSTTIGDVPRLPPNRTGLGDSSSPSLDLVEYYCDLHTTLFGTVSFQAALLGMATMAILFSWNAVRLFGFPSAFFRRRIRSPISRYSRRVIEDTSNRAMRTFPRTGHRPDLAETFVTTPLLALHLAGRLILDMFTSKLIKVLLLIFAFVQGCIRLYPAHDPYFHKIQLEGWTSGQILAVIFPLSPLALVVYELLSGGRRAWHTSSNQPAHQTRATGIVQKDNLSHDHDTELRAISDGKSEGNGTGLDARQIRKSNDQGEGSVGPGGATSVLDSPEFRSYKWMSGAVWLLVVTIANFASNQLIFIYGGYSDPERLSILLFVGFVTLPASCYAWALMVLSAWSQASYYTLGYNHSSRFTPRASHLMMLIAIFSPASLFLLTQLKLHPDQRLSLGSPVQHWALYLLTGSYGAVAFYFVENVIINIIMLVKQRLRRHR